MKTVLELGQLEKDGLLEIKQVNYMICDKEDEKPPVTLGYLIEVPNENLNKIPENLKYNYEGETENSELFGVFI